MTIRDILTNIRERLQKAGIEDFEYEDFEIVDYDPYPAIKGKVSV